jgi:sulfur-oxidizing protein SoxZ
MPATDPRIKLPDTIKAGDVVEVKTLVRHVMETGNRHDKNGNQIPRDIINTFIAKFNGNEIFRAEFGPGISANPYLAFQMRAQGPGNIEITWIDDHGTATVATAALTLA